jgi:hypothetical protein
MRRLALLLVTFALLVAAPTAGAMDDDRGGAGICVKVYDTLYGRLICG